MTRLSDYATEELERLTTLTEATAKPGEFVQHGEFAEAYYRTAARMVDSKGNERPIAMGNYGAILPERRVTSFTDATELDPPQANMLAELARRKAPKPPGQVTYTMPVLD